MEIFEGYMKISPAIYFSNDFTILVWAKPKTMVKYFARIIEFGNGYGSDDIFMSYSYYDTMRFFAGVSGSIVESDVVLDFNVWYHLGVVCSQVYIDLFVNGVNVASGTVLTPRNVWMTNNYLGKSSLYPTAEDAWIELDDIRVYNRALQNSEISYEYNN